MKFIVFVLLVFNFSFAQTTATYDCKSFSAIRNKSFQNICESDQHFFSKSCLKPKDCLPIQKLKELARRYPDYRSYSEIGNPAYKLCYRLEGVPELVTFSSQNKKIQRLVCQFDTGDFMEADELLVLSRTFFN